jgi:hypothetical protein
MLFPTICIQDRRFVALQGHARHGASVWRISRRSTASHNPITTSATEHCLPHHWTPYMHTISQTNCSTFLQSSCARLSGCRLTCTSVCTAFRSYVKRRKTSQSFATLGKHSRPRGPGRTRSTIPHSSHLNVQHAHTQHWRKLITTSTHMCFFLPPSSSHPSPLLLHHRHSLRLCR